jgi:hypothetical protein
MHQLVLDKGGTHPRRQNANNFKKEKKTFLVYILKQFVKQHTTMNLHVSFIRPLIISGLMNETCRFNKMHNTSWKADFYMDEKSINKISPFTKQKKAKQ